MTSQYWENTHTCCDRIRWDSICTVNLEFYQCLFTIKLVCFITEQSHLRFAIPCTRQIMSLTNLTPGSRTISSRIQTILTRALQFLNASPFAALQRQCYYIIELNSVSGLSWVIWGVPWMATVLNLDSHSVWFINFCHICCNLIQQNE